jgi:hypothetical protein
MVPTATWPRNAHSGFDRRPPRQAGALRAAPQLLAGERKQGRALLLDRVKRRSLARLFRGGRGFYSCVGAAQFQNGPLRVELRAAA